MKKLKNIIESNLQEIQTTYKRKPLNELPQVKQSDEVVRVLRGVWSGDIDYREEFLILCLNRSNAVLGYAKISVGGVNCTTCDPKIIFQIALSCNASAIILSHNHPSGNIKPSDVDLKMTRQIVQAGKLLDITVLDHIILTSENFYSFSDNGNIY